MVDPRLRAVAEAQPYPLVFATVSGAHLYGFASADSDHDLRGVHVLAVAEVVGLDLGPETLQAAERRDDGFELDLVTHDVRKFAALLLKRNGYVLEQLLSPLVVVGGERHEELRAIAREGCVTRHHAHHYRGFADTSWRRFDEGGRRELKALLYAFRVLKTGVHLMRTGEVVADLTLLLDEAPVVPYLGELVARKRALGEHAGVEGADPRWERDVARLHDELDRSAAESSLPETPTARGALHDFVVRVRLGTA